MTQEEKRAISMVMNFLEARRRKLGQEAIPEYARTINFLDAFLKEEKREYPALRAVANGHNADSGERN